MGYFIVGLLCFISGYILCHVVNREKKIAYIKDDIGIKEKIIENANEEIERIKRKLGKEIKERDRDEIIKDIDDYFLEYPYDRDSE